MTIYNTECEISFPDMNFSYEMKLEVEFHHDPGYKGSNYEPPQAPEIEIEGIYQDFSVLPDIEVIYQYVASKTSIEQRDQLLQMLIADLLDRQKDKDQLIDAIWQSRED